MYLKTIVILQSYNGKNVAQSNFLKKTKSFIFKSCKASNFAGVKIKLLLVLPFKLVVSQIAFKSKSTKKISFLHRENKITEVINFKKIECKKFCYRL